MPVVGGLARREPPVACSLSTRRNTSSLSRLLAASSVTQGYFLWKSRKIGAQFSWSVLEERVRVPPSFLDASMSRA
ncbi:hypothetical protein ACU635_29750 [[Actinomadura] parvosata]|uniref:hypothetical protein n=1 Tax=[Actinomadura] parvosata TaxID=1955412 RepID=UPI00406C1FCA